MDALFTAIKVLIIIQLVLFGMGLILLFCTKSFIDRKKKYKAVVLKSIYESMEISVRDNEILQQADITKYAKNLPETLLAINKLKESTSEFESFDRFAQHLSNRVLKPCARTYCHSKNWQKRYLAVLCYEYGFEEIDEKNIANLIRDLNHLVSITASKLSINYGNERLIEVFVEHFSELRRLHQRAESDILSEKNLDLVPIVESILKRERGVYKKIFCYRILAHYESPLINIDLVRKDLNQQNVDLKIAALNYIASITLPEKYEFIYEFADDDDWGIRSVVANILGKDGSTRSINILSKLIKDQEWVVRTNAAGALAKLNQLGIEVLQSQSPDDDMYAYEAAQEALYNHKLFAKGT